MRNIQSITAVFVFVLSTMTMNCTAQRNERSKIEAEYLTRAQENIEKHRKGNAIIKVVDAKGRPVKNTKVVLNQISQDFLFGNTAFDLTRFGSSDESRDDVFKEKFKALFNMAVLPFYWSNYESKQGKTKWENNQKVIEWCMANGITIKGHTLGWTHVAGTPSWLLKQPYETALELYKAHILNTVSGFEGEIDIWDVVNEPVNTIPLNYVLRDTANNDWRIGEGKRYEVSGITIDETLPWVEQSFRWAFEANPKANLILNEFNQIAVPATREKFFQFVKELQRRKVPLSGIGLQAHEPREMWYSPVEFYATLDLYAALDLPIHITEFTPQSSGKEITGNWREGKWTADAQAEFAVQFYTLAFGHPAIQSINWWGLCDKNIWLKGGGLLDMEYKPKPVYTALLKLIKEEWMTKNLCVLSGKKGMVNVRGFFGKYELEVTTPDGKVKKQNVELKDKQENLWLVELK